MCTDEKLTRPYGVNAMIFVRNLQQRILNNIIMLKLKCKEDVIKSQLRKQLT